MSTENTEREQSRAADQQGRNEALVMQTITFVVDAWPTEIMEWDMPVSVWQCWPGSEPPKQAEGTKRYRIQCQIPKTLKEHDGDAENVTVQSA